MSSRLEQLMAMSQEELAKALLAKESSQRKVNKLTLKVGAKGGVSLYGVGRFPVTLYASQWERVSELITNGELAKFIADNADALKRKGEAE
jgi:hypothetical protein